MPLKFAPPYPVGTCKTCNVPMNVAGPAFECPRCSARRTRRDFIVPMDAMERLTQRFEKLARRAARLSIEGPRLVLGERIDIPETDAFERETGAIASFMAVRVEGAAPKLPGYELVGVIRHLKEENANLIAAVGEHQIPETFRHTGPVCDHCHVHRDRNDTFIVRHDSGQLVQVGRSCLRDYLGHGAVERIAAIAEMMADALEELDDCEGDWDDFAWFVGGNRRVSDWSLVAYLAYVSAVIDRYGWCSRATASIHPDVESTSDIAWRWMVENYQAWRRSTGHHSVVLEYPEPDERDYARANAAREWAQALHESNDTLSDYEHNINVVARVSRVEWRTHGIGASIVVAYDRAVAKKRERAVSQWFGTVKVPGNKKYKRETFTLTVVAAITVGMNSRFGSSTLHVMRDGSGNKAVWTTHATTLEVGTAYRIKATVDEHSEYKGERQTVLSRCEVVEKLEPQADGCASGETMAAA